VVQATAVTARRFTIRFLPDDRAFRADAPVDLYVAASGAGILLDQPCGSQAACGQCRVRVLEGAPPPGEADRLLITDADLASGWRLGCRLVLADDATVEVPVVAHSPAGKAFGDDLSPRDRVPPVITTGTISVASLAGPAAQSSLLDAVAAAAGLVERSLVAAPAALVELAEAASDPFGSDSPSPELTVVLHGRELVTARRGPARRSFGLAVDIGTTSLAAALVALDEGRVLASRSTLNPQSAYGADVITRIAHASVPGGLAHLVDAVRAGIASLLGDLRAAVECDSADIVVAAAAGNPTMMHLWLGVSPASLGRAPFPGAWGDSLAVKARDLGLDIHPNATVLTFPAVRSHVGGDAVAASIAAGLDRSRVTSLLIDLGTNTELVLAHDGRLFATSAAAGPAFEGVTIRDGMRAGAGAIDAVSVTAERGVRLSTVGGAPPRGICGSGLVDAVADLLRTGVLSPGGAMRAPSETALPAEVSGRIVESGGHRVFQLVTASQGRAVVVSARDVRQVQLAKGSIVAAAALLCEHAGIDLAALDEVLVAGAFGNFMRKSSAQRIGLLPPVDPERVRLLGNAAGIGARLAILDADVIERARELAARVDYVDLAAHPRYQDAFLAALAFPES
jgi:uncharacterized 2Fe-2S/4Fe-4S cluster protein (DUF4445 family)